MIKSMTGYGGAKGVSDKLELSIEIRSVNSRYLDCNVKIPRVYTSFEDKIKSTVQGEISRGKVDVYINIDSTNAENVTISANLPLAQAYFDAVGAIAEKLGLENDLSAVTVARFQDVLRAEKTEADADALLNDINLILQEALSGFRAMREAEGERLFQDVASRLDTIDELVKTIEAKSPETVSEYRKKLERRMEEVLSGADIDQNRILLEAALFADRVSVDEEVVRLRSHIGQMRGLLQSDEPVGRKIDFLVQELNREANTIGSKANNSELAHVVVALKAEIEKIREQAQNIE